MSLQLETHICHLTRFALFFLDGLSSKEVRQPLVDASSRFSPCQQDVALSRIQLVRSPIADRRQ